MNSALKRGDTHPKLLLILGDIADPCGTPAFDVNGNDLLFLWSAVYYLLMVKCAKSFLVMTGML